MSLIVDTAGHSDDIEEENNVLRQQLQTLFNQLMLLSAQQNQTASAPAPNHASKDSQDSDSQVILEQKALVESLSREKAELAEQCQGLQDLVARLESAAAESARKEEESKLLQEQLRDQLQALSLKHEGLTSDLAAATDQAQLLTTQLHRAAGEVSSYKNKCESQSLEIIRLKGALESRARLQIPTIVPERPGEARLATTPVKAPSREKIGVGMDEGDQACGCGHLPWRIIPEEKPVSRLPNDRRKVGHRQYK